MIQQQLQLAGGGIRPCGVGEGGWRVRSGAQQTSQHARAVRCVTASVVVMVCTIWGLHY